MYNTYYKIPTRQTTCHDALGTSLRLGKRHFDCYLNFTRPLQSIFAVRQGLQPHLLNAVLFTEFDVFVAATRLVRIEEPESVSSVLRQNGHGGDKLLGTANISVCCKMTGSQNLRQGTAARLPKGAGSGRRGAGRRLLGQWLGTTPPLANLNDKKYDKKYNKYHKVVLGDLTAKGNWGMCNLPHAHTPQATISSCVWDNDTRLPESGVAMAGGSARHCPRGLRRDVQWAQTGVCAIKHSSALALTQASQQEPPNSVWSGWAQIARP